eukprot:TRINITY_DN2420_c0_g1_i1.p1 TRINITY_DN2420_c0_g1~~TRINITY_DN2420_c0_g1_i1.p1  ORF type:complete len:334 (-),score=65.79 TRINITY_DN2420_c0_g1_i1:41-1042(-)
MATNVSELLPVRSKGSSSDKSEERIGLLVNHDWKILEEEAKSEIESMHRYELDRKLLLILSLFALFLISVSVWALIEYILNRSYLDVLLLTFSFASVTSGLIGLIFNSVWHMRNAKHFFREDLFIFGMSYKWDVCVTKKLKPFEHSRSMVAFAFFAFFFGLITLILIPTFYYVSWNEEMGLKKSLLSHKLGRLTVMSVTITLLSIFLILFTYLDYRVQMKRRSRDAIYSWALSRGFIYHLGAFYMIRRTEANLQSKDKENGYNLAGVGLKTEGELLEITLTLESHLNPNDPIEIPMVFYAPKRELNNVTSSLKTFMEGYCTSELESNQAKQMP